LRAAGLLSKNAPVPHSSREGKEWSAEQIVELAPRRILDVGPGVGTYVDLLRPLLPDSHWTGLEIHRPYVERFELTDRYDDVSVGDVRSFDWRAQGDWDLVIFGDVLEHLDVPDARLAWCRALRASGHVLASLPIVDYPQGECEGNVHECHRASYHHDLVTSAFPGIVRHATGRQIGVYLAAGTVRVRGHERHDPSSALGSPLNAPGTG
jgi:SAM-dependent methyltransferase